MGNDIDTGQKPGLLSVEAVARRLNVKRETVYAYVSRGLLRRIDAESGISLFDPLEVERIAGRSRKAARPPAPAPDFCSALTVITGGQPYYRGRPVLELIDRMNFEQVAHLLWSDTEQQPDTRFGTPIADKSLARVYVGMPGSALPLEKLRPLVGLIGAGDAMRHDLRHGAVVAAVPRLLRLLLGAMPRLGDGAEEDDGFASGLWSRLTAEAATPELVRLLDATLVLLADHDLGPPSTVSVRLAAAVRADIYCVLSIGLNAGGGAVQDASSLGVEAYLNVLRRGGSVGEMIGEQLRHGRDMPGFGHRAYPDGDPRATCILDMLRKSGCGADRMARIDELLSIQRDRGLPHPNVGFALAALAYVCLMVRGAGEAIFNFARCAGWTAHALEEYESPRELPRVQSVYAGRPAGSTR